MLPELTITDHFTPEEEQAILDRLQAYNIENFGPMDRKDLAIILRDGAGEPEGGLLGRTGRGWLYVQMLFVPEHLRGQGIAKRLLADGMRRTAQAWARLIPAASRARSNRAPALSRGSSASATSVFDISTPTIATKPPGVPARPDNPLSRIEVNGKHLG